MDTLEQPRLVDNGSELRETGLVHRVLQPATPGPYPTVVMLHGRKGNEDVTWIFRPTIPRHWLIIAPRAVIAEPSGGYSWMLQQSDDWPTTNDFSPVVDKLQHFLGALPGLYNADADRIYLLGFSQGAAVAISAALAKPTIARGLACLVGFAPAIDGATVAGQLDQVPVFVAIGRHDDRIPAEKSWHQVSLLKHAGADVELHEYDTGHKMTAEGMRDLQGWWRART